MLENTDEPFTIVSKVQSSGILFKKSFAPHSNKWNKRFFIVKEGFLLYYSENEKKSYDKKGYFNIHPKGVIPIGGSLIQESNDVNQEYGIKISSDAFINGSVVLAAETRFDQERWIQALQEAARITWENSRMGESIIRDLETQGLKLNKEKHSYLEKLHEETIALQDEIDKNEELERLNVILDEEKHKLEKTIEEFKKDYESMKFEYEETIAAMQLLQYDKEELQTTTSVLMKSLSDLEEQKKTILADLNRADSCEEVPANSKKLQEHLQGLEEEKRCLLEEKNEIDERFLENEIHAKILEEEKQLISEESSNLLSSLNDLLAQKDLDESELWVEMSARLKAEHQLQLAQHSVHKLEGVLGKETNSSVLCSKILPDVKKLREFFENVAEEAKVDANMPVIMKNAVYARKILAKKARVQMMQRNRKEKVLSLGYNIDEISNVERPLSRSLSIMISGKNFKPHFRRTNSLRESNGVVLNTNTEDESTTMQCITEASNL